MVLVSLLAVSTTSILFYNKEIKSLESAAIEYAQMQATLISASVESSILFLDEDSAQTTIELLTSDKQVIHAAIYLENEHLFSHYNANSRTFPPVISLEKQQT